MGSPRVTVEVQALFATLRKVFPHLRRKKVLEVALSFDGEQFCVDFQGAQYGAHGVGEWKGTARLSLVMFEAIVRAYQEKTIVFEYRDGKLRIGNTSVVAHWQDLPGVLLDLAIDTPEADLLAICLVAPPAHVIASGVGPRFQHAKEQLAKRIDRASDALGAYGDFRQEIEGMVLDELRDRGRKGARRFEALHTDTDLEDRDA